MRHLILPLLLALSAAWATPVQLRAPDGLTLHAEATPAAQPGAARPWGAVLLLHSAARNRHELDAVARRLAQEGYASLALDQRSGGEYGGHPNLTAQGLGQRVLTGADELADLEVALGWLRRRYPGRPLFALGSGRSATLLFGLAAKQPGLAGILAFSPNPSDLPDLDALAAARHVRVPVFVTSENGPYAVETAGNFLHAAQSARKVQYVPPGFGLPGAQSLDPAAMDGPEASEEYWRALLRFLRAR
ncbi:alpha/beta hydrolase [Deinococcus budaensis]|uniref:Dienelactone hydrolase n=1 Tax=Deinococcus budaensis TaxID=1665626 RepID=A0A7W8GDA5_9DEIO|nr:alpha/beta hydrolase [Deinococcus budaensis]MBB5233324.1 dienelactone hydrolase [Deinococcus budaensis]